MKNGELSFRSGHVWFGEQANQAIFEPSHIQEVALQTDMPAALTEMAVYLRLSFTGISFGGLGCRFTPDTAGRTLIRVSVFEEYRPLVGLSTELADVVLAEAGRVLGAKNVVGSGVLHFDRAMYHLVESSPAVFMVLTQALISLLDPNNTIESNDSFEALIMEKHWQRHIKGIPK
ncbi:MAG: hypothetical protein K8L97_03305 [Anaerolineae bacterium]|nr:hypothetical protein [Anaerolineae bacterium]